MDENYCFDAVEGFFFFLTRVVCKVIVLEAIRIVLGIRIIRIIFIITKINVVISRKLT